MSNKEKRILSLMTLAAGVKSFFSSTEEKREPSIFTQDPTKREQAINAAEEKRRRKNAQRILHATVKKVGE